MNPQEFELTPELVRRCRRYGLDAVLEIERWKTLMRGMDVEDARASFLQYVAGRRRKPLLRAVAFLLILAACRRETPAPVASKPQPTTTREAAAPSLEPAPLPPMPEPLPPRSVPVKRAAIGYPGPVRALGLFTEVQEKTRAVTPPGPIVYPARITIKSNPAGITYTIACDCQIVGNAVLCAVSRDCLTGADGNCIAVLPLPVAPWHACKWGRDEEGWVAFTYGSALVQ